jgi:exonuclease SbcC
LRNLLVQYEKSLDKYKKTQIEYEKIRDLSKVANEEYRKLNEAFLDGQAGILAQSLSEGVPCPVCGSLEHPEPAMLSADVPTEEKLKKAKKKADELSENTADASKEAAEMKGLSDSKYDELKGGAKEIINETVSETGDNFPAGLSYLIEKKIADNEKEIEFLRKETEKENTKANRKKEIEKGLPGLEKDIKEREKELSDNGKSRVSLSAEIKSLESALDKLRGALVFETKEEAESDIARSVKTKKKFEAVIENTKEAFEKHNLALNDLKTQIKTIKKQISDSSEGSSEGSSECSSEGEQIDIEKLKEEKSDLVKEKKEITGKISNVSTRLDTNNRIMENIGKRRKEVSGVEEKWRWVKALSDTANGQLSGKDKIMLETFVQASYFERILHRANVRLMTMSGGQYELKRAGNASDQRSQSGLDLDVVDHYNATERSVKTLSGGESFMASLSLALGLSDEIQSMSGGIRLDSMFIDEGFGTLDEETLSQALKVLSGLADSNLLVGIISHVSELKEKIDKQILVKKEKSGGSRATILV